MKGDSSLSMISVVSCLILCRHEHGFEHGSTGFGTRGRGGFDDGPSKPYFRSMSSDNWREGRKEGEDDDGDWRRAGPARDRNWSSSRNWRDARGGHDQDGGDRRGFDDYHRSTSAFERPSFRRSRSSGSYDDEYDGSSLPEWSTADTNDMDELGTFDASGAFMSMKVSVRDTWT
jgi:PERQ amino acid-rich with GYF domain-containing protein